MSVRSLFPIIAVAFVVLSTMVADADAAKAESNTRRLKSTKFPKSMKATKATRRPKSPKSSKGTSAPTAVPTAVPTAPPTCAATAYSCRRMLDTGDRRLSLKYMTDRFNEEGSVRSFVDSLGYEVDLHSGKGEKEDVLSKEDCENLMSLLVTGPHIEEDRAFHDFQKYIDEAELVSIIGKVGSDTTLHVVVHVRMGMSRAPSSLPDLISQPSHRYCSLSF